MTKHQIWLLAICIILLGSFLRFYRLSSVPVSLYWEEAALGYDAYSILKTGKDFHGNPWPLVAFESFGDFKPSGYFYAAAISELFLGQNEFAVRLPSALAGIGILIVGMMLALEIFKKEKERYWLMVVSGFVIALSPWALQFSRAGFEANLAAFFSSLGVLWLLKSQKKNVYLLPSSLCFVISAYTYHSARVFIPLLGLAYLLLFWKVVKNQWKWVLTAGITAMVLTAPLLVNIKNPEIKHRFQETSAFMDPEPIARINQLREADGNTLLARAVHHRYWYYLQTFLKNYAAHFEPNYLFLSGDSNLRHSTGQTGIFYLLDAAFLFIGLLVIIRVRPFRKKIFLVLWWLLALVPAGLTKSAPHALRTLLALPAPQLIVSLGIVKCFEILNPKQEIRNKSKIQNPKLKTKFDLVNMLWTLIFRTLKLFRISNFVLGIFLIGYLFFVFRYLHDYFGDYALRSGWDWQYGYKEMTKYVFENKEKYDKIYISRYLGRPSINYFFYNQIDPNRVQAQEKRAKKDQGERLEFDNIVFNVPDKVLPDKKSLLVLGSKELFEGKLLRQISDYQNKAIFRILEIK